MTASDLAKSRMRPNADAPSVPASGLQRQQRLHQYRHMSQPVLQDLVIAKGFPMWCDLLMDDLTNKLLRFDGLLRAKEGTPSSRVRQAADVYISAPVSLAGPGIALQQQAHHYDQFEVHELQGFCTSAQHALNARSDSKEQLVRTLIANDPLLKADEAGLSSCAQHDADAAFAAQPDFPAQGSSWDQQRNFWDPLTRPQLEAICVRQGRQPQGDKQYLIQMMMDKSSLRPPTADAQQQ